MIGRTEIKTLAIFALIMALAVTSQANLLLNPGFENGDAQDADVWVESDDARRESWPDFSERGTGWWGIGVMDWGGTKNGDVYQDVSITGNTLCQFDIWTKRDSGSVTGTYWMALLWYEDDTHISSSGQYITLTDSWVEKSLNATSPGNANKVRVKFGQSASQCGKWDDAVLSISSPLASNPSPADDVTNVGITADLSWMAGYDADSRDVYFGTSYPPPFIQNQTATTYDPGAMAIDTTYYWRIDEIDAGGTNTGTDWSFTVRSPLRESFGINVHAPQAPYLNHLFDEAEACKLGWIRVDFTWHLIETSQDNFDWNVLDAVVDAANARGLNIFATLAYTPEWATDYNEAHGVPRYTADWYDFCYQAALRYSGEIEHWGMWNEPSLHCQSSEGWGATIDDRIDRYISDILINGADAVHAANPNAKVCGPELAQYYNYWFNWLKESIEQAGDKLDIVTHHGYADVEDTGKYSEVTERLNATTQYGDDPNMWETVEPSAREVLEYTGWFATGKPVWFTETGLKSDDNTDESDQADFYEGLLTDWFTGIEGQDWIDKIFFYELRDPTVHHETWGILDTAEEGYFGRKKAFYTYKNFGGVAIEERITDLISQMSLDEKIEQLYEDVPSSMRTAYNTDLGIPGFIMADGPHGVRGWDYTETATSFPVGIAMTATWDPDIIEQVGIATGKEFRGYGKNQALGPCLDLIRDPRTGRTAESGGEDPYLSSRMGVAYLDGMQSNSCIATVKHFLLNTKQENRTNNKHVIDDRTLMEHYALPFRTVIAEGAPTSLMGAYNWINGKPCSANSHLLTNILRTKLGYRYYVISDWNSIYTGAASAINAGLDLEAGSDHFTDPNGTTLADSVASGEVSVQTVDNAVRRVLRAKIEAGLLDRQPPAYRSDINSQEHQDICLEAGRKCIVLLKNQDSILPLNKTGSIALIGPSADVAQLDGCGSSKVYPPYSVTPKEGIENRAPGVTINYAEGCDMNSIDTSGFQAAKDLAAISDVVVFVGGLDYTQEGETRDREEGSINIPGVQANLINELYAVNPNVIVVLKGGGAIGVNSCVGNIKGLVYAFYPGQEGGNAIADVLFGDYNPGGKLPYTIPKTDAQLPSWGLDHSYDLTEGRGYRWYDNEAITPEFVFGHGLSYTTFSYSNLVITPAIVGAGQTVNVSVDVTNTGSCLGDEVVQLYLKDLASSVPMPVKQLKGFERITLIPNDTKTVTFTITPEELYYYDVTAECFKVEPGVFTAMVGGSSGNLPLSGNFEITGAALKPDLVVTKVKWVPPYAMAGDKVTFVATIKNQGTGASSGIHEVDFLIDETEVSWSSKLSSIEPGASLTFVTDRSVGIWTATEGAHTVKAQIDDGDIIDECIENNNTATASMEIHSHSGNLALRRPVTVSSVQTAGAEGQLAVDLNTGTRWSSNPSDTEWIYVSLGATYNVNRVVLDWENAYGKEYKIQVSDDANTWTDIYHETDGNGEIDDLTVSGTGRYVRMQGIDRGTEFGYSLFSFEVYTLGDDPSAYLKGHWELDGNADDSSGHGHDGSLVGNPQWVTGQVNGAIELDGSGDYVTIPSESFFDITSEITISCWIKVDNFSCEWQPIVTKGDSAWRISRNGWGNQIHFACNGLSPDHINGSVNVNDGEWHHIAAVYDRSKMYLYVDGVLDVSADASGNIATNNYNVAIGENLQVGWIGEFDGLIDDVRVYAKGLSADEIGDSVIGSVIRLDVPYSQRELANYSGAACLKMALDYQGTNSYTQTMLQDYGVANNSTENLGRDYIDPRGMYRMMNDYELNPNYNYAALSRTILNDAYHDICYWIAYPVPNADPENLPAMIPLDGSYGNWTVVNGFSTSDDPWTASEYTVYGFWLTDPATSGIGQNVYKTADTLADSFVVLPQPSFEAWGSNYYGQCNVPIGGYPVAVSAGGFHSIALSTSGSLAVWGANWYGQCSNVPAGNDYVAIGAGHCHNVALKSDGSLVAWGDNSSGQCNVPTGNDYVAIAVGFTFNIALKSDGSLVAWGSDYYNQCSNLPSGNDYVAIAAGSKLGVAIKSDGSLVAWGHNGQGQCDVPAGNDYIRITAGNDHGVALKSDGSLVAWGSNGYGQCDVPSGNDFVGIEAGYYHNLALKSDGSLAAWGYDNGGSGCNEVPAGIGNNFAVISAGCAHSLALRVEDDWNGKYVTVCEPPEYDAEVTIAKPVKFKNKLSSKQDIIDAAVKGLEDNVLKSDCELEAAYADSEPGKPIKVRSDNGDYFIVPFVKDDGCVVAVIVDAQNGAFKEASYSSTPDVKYLRRLLKSEGNAKCNGANSFLLTVD